MKEGKIYERKNMKIETQMGTERLSQLIYHNYLLDISIKYSRVNALSLKV